MVKVFPQTTGTITVYPEDGIDQPIVYPFRVWDGSAWSSANQLRWNGTLWRKPNATALPGPFVPPTDTLRGLMAGHGMVYGAAITSGTVNNHDSSVGTLLKNQCSSATAVMGMYPPTVWTDPDTLDFSAAEPIVNFALATGMTVYGHALIGHIFPSWLSSVGWTRTEAIAKMEWYFGEVMNRWRGVVARWEVVNEAFQSTGYTTSPWRDMIGDDYIEIALQIAHDIDPNVKLYLNDYGANTVNTKSTNIYNHYVDFLNRGIPIHGIGLQMHVTPTINTSSVASNIARFNALGIEAHISELDVRLQSPVTEQDLTDQANAFAALFQVAIDADNCYGITTWNIHDGDTWIPGFYGSSWGWPLLFDEEYQPKPAYHAVISTLMGS